MIQQLSLKLRGVGPMSKPEIVLVAGATGKQGGSVVRALSKAGYGLKALTRNPSSNAAMKLRSSGIELVVGDMLHEESLANALKGIDIVFTMTTSFQSTHENEVAQGFNMVEAAKGAGVKHFVFTSVASADRNTGIPHFETKYKVEQRLVQSGVPYTIIGPVAFMENFVQPFALPDLRSGRISRGLRGSRPVQLVAVEDIGSFAAYVVRHREEFLGKRMDIAGDERTGEETADILSGVIGRTLNYESFPPERLSAQNPDLAIMLKWQANNAYAADIAGLYHDYPEVGWHTLEEWARGIDWNVLLAG